MPTPDDATAVGDDAGSGAPRIGWVRYHFDDDRWEWSDEVARIHGYEPGTVVPTTDLVLSHKHPADRPQMAELMDRIRETRVAFSSRHRIRDVQGRIHHVVVVGNELRDETGRVVGSDGFYVDLTAYEDHRRDEMSAQVADFAEHRAAIEQAKGMLMVVYGIDAAAAFDLLRWRSQQTNVKLRLLAEQILTDFRTLQSDGALPTREVYDQVLMTAHQRIPSGPDGTETGGENRAGAAS
ncbi:PAS and ANTAR domain-containing protein [Mycolicibacterium rufum]|uniref:PAS and ANTAR domain-containing protein n=1 Tax=Mycolicibacterium rufum TaxID=318424 RepID=A0A9X2YFX2_9MYCO|nr:PAS and ANTAR domain-containing protein [Mycolicibacterium rufum]MCV7072769.1 PAS and ANTAR domain-containing protein [Mycolicibacterium rufum]ULP36962.1 PAS and ANTAR domain-containing protein [Mycolicibacterium rufum]